MRQWNPPVFAAASGQARHTAAMEPLAQMVQRLGEPAFAHGLLQDLEPVLPAASWSVYRTGHRCKPTLFMSASLGVPDTTQDCWWAYLSGPYRSDSTWGRTFEELPQAPQTRLCHVTAKEVQGEHRARVYDAHGVAERVSVVEVENDGSVFAVNFYRHQHQRAFDDRQLDAFELVAPVLLALTRKHIQLSQRGRAAAWPDAALTPPSAVAESSVLTLNGPVGPPDALPALRTRLLRLQAELTGRELDVCSRLLQGMTYEGIASDLGLGVPTVKTYRNRAFSRLGIHFRNELFACVWAH